MAAAAEAAETWISAVVTTTSTSNKIIVLALILITTISLSTASHQSNFDTGFDMPDFESHSEIVTLLVAPFLFVTLLLQITLNAVLRSTIGRGSNNGHNPNYKKFSTVMALSITAMLVPSPFWQYIIFAGDSIGVISVSILLLVFIFLFGVVARGARRMGNNNRRYRRE